jgi:hypothetical protein
MVSGERRSKTEQDYRSPRRFKNGLRKRKDIQQFIAESVKSEHIEHSLATRGLYFVLILLIVYTQCSI